MHASSKKLASSIGAAQLDTMIRRYHQADDASQKQAILSTFQAFLTASGSTAQVGVDEDGEVYLGIKVST